MSAKRVAGQLKEKTLPSALRQTFSRNVLLARAEAKLTQRELANQAEVSQRMIWEIESKARNVTLDTVSVLARSLGKTEIELLTPISWGGNRSR